MLWLEAPTASRYNQRHYDSMARLYRYLPGRYSFQWYVL